MLLFYQIIQWTSVPQLEEESRLCDNLPIAEDNPIIQPNLEASSESSTEDETNITVINEESSRDSDLTV